MAQSKYFRWQAPRRDQYGQQNDSERGLAAGAAVGKLLGGLAGGIQEMRKNAIANRLMDEASISEQPGAGVTQDLGQLPGGPGNQGDIAPRARLAGPDPDPDPTSVTYPSGGGFNPEAQPTYSTEDMPDLSTAVAKARAANTLPAPVQPGGGGDFTLDASNYTGGSKGPGTVGGLVHTGATDELALQKEMLALRLSKAQESRAAAEEADKEAERQGTGRYALDAATKRLQLAKLQGEVNKANQPEKEDKNAPPVNIDSEPVRDTNQLGDYVDNQYGTGVYSGLIKAVTAAGTGDNAAELAPSTPVLNTDGTPKLNPDGSPAMESAKNVTIPLSEANPLTGEAKKSITLPLKDVQTYIRQTNLHRLAQGLPALRVPGENQSLGLTKDKPFIAKTKLDVLSRAPGGWVQTPNGQIVQAWTDKNGQPIRPTLPPRVKR